MLVGQFDPRRTAGGGHERLSLLNFLFEFRTFIADGFHGALRYFDHVLETDGLNRAIYFFRGGVVLSENGRSDDGDHLFSFAQTLQHVEHLRNFEDRSERTTVDALAAVDAFALIDMLHAAFVLGNRLYGAGLFARYGHIDDGMVGAVAVADAATDAEIVVDDRFAGTIEFDGVFRAVGGTGPGHATFAEVGDLVVGLHARRAGFVDYAENIVFLLLPFALQGFAGIFGQRGEFVGFVGHVETHQRERFVFPHGALLVYAAATQNP